MKYYDTFLLTLGDLLGVDRDKIEESIPTEILDDLWIMYLGGREDERADCVLHLSKAMPVKIPNSSSNWGLK